jgi:hypothetical protein
MGCDGCSCEIGHELKNLRTRIKSLEEGIEKHKIETWKLVNEINHPIIDADLEIWKLIEEEGNESTNISL